jgi:transcriptional regulator, propionate catabolism operon regulatory protein
MTYSIAILAHQRIRQMIEPILKNEASKMLMNINIIAVDAVYDKAVHLIETIKNKIDIIICGQNHDMILKDRAFNCPIITLKPRAIDMINAVLKASEFTHSVAVVSQYRPNAALTVAEPILQKLGINMNLITYDDIEELELIINNLQKDGYKALVGGTLIYEMAQKYPEIDAYYYFTNEALQESATLALYLLKNKLNISNISGTVDTLINRVAVGIIICNQLGQILMLNSQAENIISCSREYAEGKYIGDLIPDFDISHFKPGEETEKIIKIHNGSYKVSIDNKAHNAHNQVIVIEFLDKNKLSLELRLKDSAPQAFTTFDNIVGNSKAIKETITLAKHYAVTRETILILGETGVGKDLFAQSIHNYSSRKDRPFWAINCATLPENLLESELFGYEEGAFTGAKKGGKQGYFELANRGTIFLDEIGELSMSIQVKLLRVLEQGHVLHLGGKHFIPTDVRIVCATNRNLIQAVREGAFREDLFYRINVLQLHIPPLRLRKEDIRPLVEHFCEKIKPDSRINQESIDFLSRIMSEYDFPGNVRELENLVRRFLVVKMIYSTKSQLEEFFFNTIDSKKHDVIIERTGAIAKREMSIETIKSTMSKYRGNKSKTARELGISRTTIWRQLNKLEK